MLSVTIFDPHVLVGLVAPLLFVISVILGGWSYMRVQVASAQKHAIETWRENYQAELARNERLEETVGELRGQNRSLSEHLSEERKRTDLTGMMKQISDQHLELIRSAAGNRDDAVREVERALKNSEERILAKLGELSTSQLRQAEVLERVAGILNGHS